MEHSTRSQSPPHHVSAAAEPEACAAEVANVISNVEGQAEIKEAAADMPGFALAQKRPTLASLPNELLLLIMEALPPTVAYGVNHQMLAARSLSWTSRILRAFALPQAWPAEVRITTLAQLGKLREMLRASPLTRTHIKSFVFDWHMGRDGCAAIMDFPPETGSLLQLAFRNRRQLWQELALQWNCSVVDNGGSGRRFSHNGRTYGEPGRGGGPGSGPDGKGEDALIKSPQDLNACIIEVIGLLPCLDSFSWKSSVTPMSAETCDALAQHSTLKSLHVTMSSCRNNAHALPFWNIAPKLQVLSLAQGPDARRAVVSGEQDEASLASWELPAGLPTTSDECAGLHHSVAARTIIAAARGGQLRRLILNFAHGFDHLFALPSLLPHWIGVQIWDYSGSPPIWLSVLSEWNDRLAYASFGMYVKTGEPRSDRLLSPLEVDKLMPRSPTHRMSKWHKGTFEGDIQPLLMQDESQLHESLARGIVA